MPPAVDHSVKSPDSPDIPVTTFYPGTTDPATARPLDVGAGSRLDGTDITIVRAHPYKISLHVDVPPGLHANTGLIHSFGGLPPNRLYDVNSNGDIQIPDVPPGAYKLQIWAGEPNIPNAGVPIFCVTTIPISVGDHDVDGLRVTPGGCAVAEGRVVVEGDDKATLGGIMAMFDHGRLEVALRPDGSFKTGLSAGANDIDLSHITTEQSLYVKSIRSGNQDVLRNGFTAGPSEHVDLEVVLASDGGRIEGTVSDADDKPVIGATVVLIPNDPALRARFDFGRDAVTDQTGHFELKDAAPGEYKLFAWDDIEPMSWFDPNVLKDYEAKGEPVTVKVKDSQTIKLHVIP